MKQPALLDVGERQRVCRTCRTALVMNRCPPCGNITPRPGSASWRRWTQGLIAEFRERIERADLSGVAASAAQALLLGGEMPREAAPLLADMMALPISVDAYQALVDRAVFAWQVSQILLKRGMAPADAERLGYEAADEWAAKKGLRLRVAVDEPVQLRVAVERLRGEAPEVDAELEAEAVEEAARVVARAGR